MNEKINIMSYTDISKLDKLELLDWLITNYNYEVPSSMETIDDMKEASRLLMLVTNANSFLTNVVAYVSIMKRNYKREYERYKKGTEEYIGVKRLYEDFVDKEVILSNKIDMLNDIKQTISRMITIKQEIDKELYLSGDNS